MLVILPRKIRHELSTVARAAYPNEVFAFLLGNKKQNKYVVQKLYFPPAKTSPQSVSFEISEAIQEAFEEASEENLDILGDIHSHPKFIDTSPSEHDWDNCKEFEKFYISEPIMGILAVFADKKSKLRTRVRFWPWLKDTICQKIL